MNFHPKIRAFLYLGPALVAGITSARANTSTPLNILTRHGGKADIALPLVWGISAISASVVIIIAVLLAASIWRRPGIAPVPPGEKLAVERPAGGLNWIWIGVGVSSIVLLASVVWTVDVLAHITSPPSKPAITIEVTGRQWWWQVRYLSHDPARNFITANEIHIPTGQPVMVKLVGGDVIHSFWVPALSGKTDVIPGQTNEIWLEAGKPGIYRGQCSEYCGVQHAHMGFLVVAQTPDKFEAWWNGQLHSPKPATDRSVMAGMEDFNARCGSCHAVRGTDASGILGPDLSHLMQRRTIAAATLANNPVNLRRWIDDPQAFKPGALMPKPELTAGELGDIQHYLETLR